MEGAHVIKSFRILFTHGMLTLCLASGLAHAQTSIGPLPQSPANYGLPTSPLLSGWEMSVRSSIAFSFNLQVALADVQAVLPVGYTALPAVTGGTTANVTCQFWLQNQLQLTTSVGGFAPGSYGPFNSFDCSVFASPPPGQQNPLGFEQIQLIRYVNNQEIADLRNALEGANSNRYGVIDGRVRTTTDGVLRMAATVDDPDSSFHLSATLTGAPVINQQLRQVGAGLVLRFVDMTSVPAIARTSNSITVSGDLAGITDPAALVVPRLRLSTGTFSRADGGARCRRRLTSMSPERLYAVSQPRPRSKS